MELESISISASYAVLFLILWLYGYEIMFRYVILLVAITGLCWSGIYFIPYGLILWRIYVGANVSTKRKLYIGQFTGGLECTSDDPSNTSAHWIVAMDNETDFLYTHAVGRVISGRGEKKPFKHVTEERLRHLYALTHVGYVTAKNTRAKMVEVVRLEPMKSGNSCQEFAVDIAFQMSGSRTYTLMKTMAILRLRTVIFYSLLTVSILLYLAQLHWLARVCNPIVLGNLFAALELSSIGILNTRVQHGILPVLKAYLGYPKAADFLQLVLLSLMMCILYYKIGLVESALIGFILMLIISMKA